MENRTQNWFGKAKPFIAVVSMQFGYAVSDILSKAAMNKGMSIYVFVMYRNAVAFIVMAPFAVYFDRKVRPKMTFSIFIKIVAIRVLSSVIGQNLYFLAMRFTTAAFAAALSDILPAITFILACILRCHPILFGSHGGISHNQHHDGTNPLKTISGSVMIIIACFSWAFSVILQAITLKTYPAALSLTSWVCLLATLEGATVATIMERSNRSVWSLKWDMRLLSAVYTGIVVSGLSYYLQGVVIKTRGPVFVTSFSPFGMLIVAIMSYFIMAEQMFLGRVIGAIVICLGLYLVVWGKSIDYNPPKPNIQEHVLQDKQIVEGGNAKNGHCTHEVITIQ